MYVEINIRDFLKKLYPYDETEYKLDLIIKLQILYRTETYIYKHKLPHTSPPSREQDLLCFLQVLSKYLDRTHSELCQAVPLYLEVNLAVLCHTQ